MGLTPRRQWRVLRRILGKWVLTLVIVGVTLGLSLPTLLSQPLAQKWLLNQANAALAPARLEVGSWSLSWVSPTTLQDCRLFDAQGKIVLASEQVSCDRNLFQWIWGRPELGTWDLGAVAIHLERDDHGIVNLMSCLKPILSGDPFLHIKIQASGGPITFRDAQFPLPLDASDSALIVELNPRPHPTT